MIRAIIIDDEEKSRKLLNNLINAYCQDVEVVEMADSADSGINAIAIHEPDLVFLDIVMPGKNGFQLLEEVKKKIFEVIFTTAYDEYALKAIKISALDYLLKPICIDDLQSAIKKVELNLNSNSGEKYFSDRLENFLENYRTLKVEANKIGIPTHNGIRFVEIKDIAVCKAEGNYTELYFIRNPQKEVISKTLKEFDKLLDRFNFIRVHRSYLVNLENIKEYKRNNETIEVDGDGGCVVMLNNMIIPVSRDKRKILLNKFSKPF